MLIHEVNNRSEYYEEACRHYLNLILIEIQRNTQINYDYPSKEKNNRDCTFVKEYLDDHFTENITLDLLSKESKMNKYYLVHSFTMKNESRKVKIFWKQQIIQSHPLHL